MKNRRLVIVSFLLVATLCIGMGYALVTTLLDVQGTANINATAMETLFDEKVYFSAAVANETGNTAQVNADSEKDKCTFTVNTLVKKDDVATFTFTIKNDYAHKIKVTPKLASNTNPTYFDVTSDWSGATKEIAANGGELTYTLTVKLLETPTTAIGTSISIEFTATSEVEPTTP